MRYKLIFLILFIAGIISAQNAGYPKPSYIRWLPETGTYYLLVGDTTTHAGAWFELGAGFAINDGVISVATANSDSVFVMGDSLCAISLGDTVCVANDSVFITQDSFCYIVNGDTSCVAFNGGIEGINIYNSSDTISAGENRIVTIPSNSTLAFKESGSTDFMKMYPTGDSTVFSKDVQFNAGILDGDGDIGGAGQVMTTTGSQTNWVNPAALNVPISGLFSALGTNTKDHASYQQEWQWNSHTGAADGLKLSSTSTVLSGTGALFSSQISGANSNTGISSTAGYFRNTHTGTGSVNYGVKGEATGGSTNYGVYGITTSGTSIYGYTESGTGLYGYATSGTPLILKKEAASTNDVVVAQTVTRMTSGTAANGIGASINFSLQNTNGVPSVANTISSEWSEATYATRGTKFTLAGVSAGIDKTALEILGSGATRLNQYGTGAFTGTPTYTLQVDASGNIIEGATSGSTKLNSITAADGNASPNHGANAIDWQWNTLAAGTGLKLSSTSTVASGSTQKLFQVALSGANATASQTTYAAYLSNTHTGTSPINYGIYCLVTGGTNYGIFGDVTDGVGVYGRGTTSGTGVTGQSTSGYGGRFTSQSGTSSLYTSNDAGVGVWSQSTGSASGWFTRSDASTNTVTQNLRVERFSSGTAANGIGESIDFHIQTATSTGVANKIKSLWSNATHATRISQMVITGVNAGIESDIIYLEGDKRTRFNGRAEMTQGADVASVAGAIALGYDGNVFEITGTNAITLISNVGWQNGSEVTLLFTSTASLTDGTANSGTDIGMELNGNANFTGSADDSVTLVLSEIGGTQRWREKCRSVN